MIFTGMIFQFNSAEGTGLIMSSKGDSKTFSQENWIDTSTSPAVGLKVSFEGSDLLVNIQELKEENLTAAPDKSEGKVEFSSVDEYINHFKDLGYKLAKDMDDGQSRIASLRIFLEDGHGETIITQTGSKITVQKFVNGKEVN